MTLEGYELIKHFEGCRLKAYKCPAGIWTIGYGSTRYSNGEKVKEGDRITQEEANALFQRTVDEFEYQVKLLLGNELCTKLHPHSLSALVSFAYNVGVSKQQCSSRWKKAEYEGLVLEPYLDEWETMEKTVLIDGLSSKKEALIYEDSIIRTLQMNDLCINKKRSGLITSDINAYAREWKKNNPEYREYQKQYDKQRYQNKKLQKQNPQID